uniref:Ubiquitin specific peptidase 40 n=1 Tax=Astyanax mexicanus TaxID=7994 RepID=A0A8B9GZ44_ASTMX
MFGDLFEQDEEGLGDSGAGVHTGGGKEREPQPPRGPIQLSGIRNQGGTCYLNALLQTLLFTPEFRGELFARLLLLDEQTASTTALTDSFGWTNHEETSQHDVQELNRILFSALESSLVGTSGSSLIQELYHGTLVNQITCKECKNVSERQEDFLDLTVCVRGVSGLEEALWSMFVEEEVFEGNNLYRCSRCERLVCASKAAKLRKLPPFLTVSLLRFSFDFEKCERYKETSTYSFPLSINLLPYCEQSSLPDSEFSYELFSVIIHKGGCYGGHYHVYIKDIDQLGHWEAPEEDVKEKEKVQVKPQSLNEFDVTLEAEDPMAALIAVIAQEPSGSVMLDQLGQKLMGRIGSSWNKKFRKQYGPISKFLQSRSDVFLLVSNGSRVTLNPKYTLTHSHNNGQEMAEEHGYHWFDLNDSTVTPIKEQDIKKQFKGKESAYMLFYRKCTLQRPPDAKGNPAYKVPPHLLEMIQEENARLQQKRLEFEASSNSVELRLHLAPFYRVQNGALQPVSTNTSPTSMTFDRRKPVGDLRLTVYQMQDQWEGDMALTIAKHLPAGLHLYNTLADDQQSLYSAGISNGCDLFVWNGREVNGVQVQVGAEWEPVLLTVMRPQDAGCEPVDGSGLQRSSHGFPRALTLDHVREALGPQEALVCQEENRAGPDGGGASGWRVCSTEAMRKTLRELTLRDGDTLLLLPPTHTCDSVFSVNGDLVTVMTPSDCRWLKVQFQLQSGMEEEEECLMRKIPASGDTVKDKACKAESVPCCLRQMDRMGKLLPPVREDLSVRDAGVRLMTSLYLCPGPSLKTTQIFLYCRVSTAASSVPELELIVEETLSVKECLMEVIRAAGMEGACWHLRRMDWCEEVGEPLRDENMSLLEVGVSNGDTMVLTEGQLPPKVWSLDLNWRVFCSVELQYTITVLCVCVCVSGWAGVKCGFVEISEEASLQDLKCQVMTLPALMDVCVPTPEFLRVWLLEEQRATRILRGNTQTLRKLKVVCGSELCVQKLQCEENLGLKDVLLRVRMGVPGEREYYPSMEFVWDAGRDPSAKGLYSSLSSLYGILPDNLLVAKYLPDKHTWMPIHNWTQQVSKRKKKKKVDSVQGAPYYLRDGDIIGVKMRTHNPSSFCTANTIGSFLT